MLQSSGLHEASQDFDHLYAGSHCKPDGRLMSTNRPCATPGGMTFTRAWQETASRTLSNALDLTGKFRTGAVTHDLLVGLEYVNERRDPSLATSASDSFLTYRQPVDPYHPVWLLPHTPRRAPTTVNRHRAEAQALYLQDLVTLTPQWKMLAGLRYDRFEFGTRNVLTNRQRSYRGNTVSPRVGVIWQPVPQHSLYASYAKNFSPYGGRGMISGVAVEDNAVYDDEPQYSRQFEVGAKSDWLDGRLSSQVSLYSLALYNQRYRPDPDRAPCLWAVRGIEASMTCRGPICNDAANTSERSGYTRWDASVGWRAMPWTVTLAVTNLTDKRYWRSTRMPGAPRIFLLSGDYVF